MTFSLKSRFRSQDIITALPVTSWEPPNPRKNDIWLFCLPVNLQCFCSFRFTTQKVQFSQAIARLGGPKDGGGGPHPGGYFGGDFWDLNVYRARDQKFRVEMIKIKRHMDPKVRKSTRCVRCSVRLNRSRRIDLAMMSWNQVPCCQSGTQITSHITLHHITSPHHIATTHHITSYQPSHHLHITHHITYTSRHTSNQEYKKKCWNRRG